MSEDAIRHAVPADLPAISDLHLRSWRSAYRGMLPDAYLDGPVADEMRARWSALPDPAIVLLCEGGFACCLLDRAVPYLDNLHAAPGRRRRGTGRRLMARLAGELLRQGHRALSLTVIDANAPARAFYASVGGREGAPFPERIGGAEIAIREVAWDRPALVRLASLDAATGRA